MSIHRRDARRDSNVKPLEAFDLATRSGRYQARLAGHAVPKQQPGIPAKPFWSFVNKTDSCWFWTGTINPVTGYGLYHYAGRTHRAHRWAWNSMHGPIPAEQVVCHKCDVKTCVRPDHLFIGTHADNVADKVAKGRQARGERQGTAKLTSDKAAEIRERWQTVNGLTKAALARDFGVCRRTVLNVINGTIWR